MSAIIGGIGPVSVRYAAQIRELLFAQAMQRLVAEEHAARATEKAETTLRREAVREPAAEPVRIDMARVSPEPASAERPGAEAASPAPAQLVDIQA